MLTHQHRGHDHGDGAGLYTHLIIVDVTKISFDSPSRGLRSW